MYVGESGAHFKILPAASADEASLHCVCIPSRQSLYFESKQLENIIQVNSHVEVFYLLGLVN